MERKHTDVKCKASKKDERGKTELQSLVSQTTLGTE